MSTVLCPGSGMKNESAIDVPTVTCGMLRSKEFNSKSSQSIALSCDLITKKLVNRPTILLRIQYSISIVVLSNPVVMFPVVRCV